MSVESMRRQLNALQYSVLVKSATDEKYAMPSRASAQAKRIYRSVKSELERVAVQAES